MTCIWRMLIAGCCALAMAWPAGAGQAGGTVEGSVADSSGGRLPGVRVEVVRRASDTAAVSVATTGEDGAFRFPALQPGEFIVRFTLDGFATVHTPVRVEAGVSATVTATLAVGGLSESIHVAAADGGLDVSTATQTATFSKEALNNLPTASRNYTHVIVSEAGVSAPLPDRTGKGLNIATTPGAQGDDASQSLNPSVNGARPTNNGLRIN